MDPRPALAEDAAWIRSLLRERWGGVEVVSRGRVHRADELPAFVGDGLATYRIDGDECELVTLDSLAPGAGTRLLDAVAGAARAAGCRRLWLITTNDNVDALRFYQRRGLRLAAVHRDAVARSRELKPSIPAIGHHAIPIRDEIELDLNL
jgi:GNAT superfamily N-acetyltransferase